MQNGFVYPTPTHKQHWNHSSLEENGGGGQEFAAEQSKYTSLPNLLSFEVSSSPLFERYTFKRTRRWPRGRSAACWLHRPISVSAIHTGVPGLLQPLHLLRNRALNTDLSSLRCSHVSATMRDTLCTAKQVRSSAKRPWAQGNVEQRSPAKLHTSSPAGMKYWQATCSSCIASSAKNTSVIRKHAQGVMKSLPRGNKHLASRRESGRT